MGFDLSEWASAHLDGSQRGDEFSATCPWCGRRGKFALNIEKGYYNCYRASCRQRGKTPHYLIAFVEGVRVGQIYERLGSPLKDVRASHEKKAAFKASNLWDFKLPTEFIPCFKAGRTPEFRVIKYLRKRVDNEVLKEYGVGFCKEGKYFNRVLIPVSCPNGNAFTARDATTEHETNEIRSKYRNPEGEWASALLMGWEQYIKVPGQDLVLVEGPFDVLRLAMHGIPAMALLGKELGPGQVALLYKLLSSTNITLLIDPEERANTINKIALQLCMKFKNLFVGKLPFKVDAGDSTKEQAFAAIDTARKWK